MMPAIPIQSSASGIALIHDLVRFDDELIVVL
jgi:hypothetical protein